MHYNAAAASEGHNAQALMQVYLQESVLFLFYQSPLKKSTYAKCDSSFLFKYKFKIHRYLHRYIFCLQKKATEIQNSENNFDWSNKWLIFIYISFYTYKAARIKTSGH